MEISWNIHVKNEALQRIKEERNILYAIKRRKVKWSGHILRRYGIIKHVTEGKIKGRTEVIGRRAKRRKQVLDDL